MNVSCAECGSVFRVDPAKIPLAGVRARCSVCGGVIAIGEPGRIDEEFAAPVGAAAARSSTPAPVPRAMPSLGAPAPLPPRPAISLPTPPHPSLIVAPSERPAVPSRPATPPVGVPLQQRASAAHAASATPRSTPAQTVERGDGAPTAAAVAPASPAPTPSRSPSVAPSASVQVPHPSAPDRRATGPAALAKRVGTRPPINPFLANDADQKARRLARALVSDIIAYFPERHREGMRNGTLSELLREEIKKSYEEYVEQMGKDFAESTTHFQDALNEVLAGGKKVF